MNTRRVIQRPRTPTVNNMKRSLPLLTALLLAPVVASAQDSAPKPSSGKPRYALPPPTLANVRYGPHERQVLDFWQTTKTQDPAPLLFYIHGGAWNYGDKKSISQGIKAPQLLDAGISVVSTNYRYIRQAEAEGVKPPVIGPLHDAARALQFVRSKAAEWKLDKTRVGAFGGSADRRAELPASGWRCTPILPTRRAAIPSRGSPPV